MRNRPIHRKAGRIAAGMSCFSRLRFRLPFNGRAVYDPKHPDADAKGYVVMPNVNVMEEMVNMISASRAYEANVQAIGATRAMWNRALEIGRS
jgi:flagellar basal-body rod protein FlgC